MVPGSGRRKPGRGYRTRPVMEDFPGFEGLVRIMDRLRGPDGCPRISGRGLNINILKGGVPNYLAVGDAVEGHPARKTKIFHPRPFMKVIQDMEINLFEHRLKRSRHIPVAIRQRIAGRPRRTEFFDPSIGIQDVLFGGTPFPVSSLRAMMCLRAADCRLCSCQEARTWRSKTSTPCR